MDNTENVDQICDVIHPICETLETLPSHFSVFLCDINIFPHFRRVTLWRSCKSC